ncbi:MAG TPA: acyltransferase [Lachnospiraceae bacterium]|nr:acyltransferase [Lachnospiraceae bacterium]HPF29224.1 acyltransferase [Lachnospiraceae bacterium]
METKRFNYIDMLKGVGIICVVAGHSTMLPVALQQWVESFHMALFFVAAGALIGQQKSYTKTSETVIKARSRSILIPFFWFSLIAMLWDTVGLYLDPQQYNVSGLKEKIWDSCTFYGVSVLWFLPAFFVAVTGYQIMRRYVKLWITTIIVIGLAVLVCLCDSIPDYILGMDKSPLVFFLQVAFVFWRGVIGMLFCAVGEIAAWGVERLREHRMIKLLLGIVLLAGGTFLAMKNGMVSFRYLIVGNMALFFLIGSAISIGFLFLCEWIGEFRPMEYLGRYSMVIFLTHLDLRVMNIAIKCSDKVFALTDNNFAKYITVGIVLILLELVIVNVMDRYFGFLLGKKRRERKAI